MDLNKIIKMTVTKYRVSCVCILTDAFENPTGASIFGLA